jgi:hypothetical protein
MCAGIDVNVGSKIETEDYDLSLEQKEGGRGLLAEIDSEGRYQRERGERGQHQIVKKGLRMPNCLRFWTMTTA